MSSHPLHPLGPILLLLLPFAFLVACEVADDDDSAPGDDDDIFAQDDDDTGPGPNDDDSSGGGGTGIIGSWVDAGGGTYTLTQTLWTITPSGGSPSTFAITKLHADNQFAVAQNGESNPEYPSLWSRFEWIPAQDATAFLCHRVQDGTDAVGAGGVSPADPNNPSVEGCRDEAWTSLSPN